MKKHILAFAATAALGLAPLANAIDFDLEDPKGVNNIVFLLDAPLESINGTATGITGSVSFDPAHPEKTSGKLVVAVDSLSVANPKMVEHMMGGKWLDQANHPTITFELKGLTNVSQDGSKVKGTAKGVMTIKGVSKEMDVPVSLSYLKGKLADRQRTPGDILVIRSNFSVSRSDFDVNAGQQEDKVADEVELRLSVGGFAPY
ncbi:YceI family protein [Pelagicoccus sp. NFK12]|uniref:YceI family protein n=1 Tax=Pelagicoccus enzymogenes TaxID=2773457 RepID=A0A927F4L9_9BACT|nr:YceI family protein [Pelagicoccus enzymogenes]MBD5777985.1 YceI family protein [Pelagicoccus enzymogenes]MDQ8197957.1 YceI family protein [Pelagicoccus enzymogenes]